MIKHPSGKATGVMAYPAILGGGNMDSGLTYGRCSVMAGGAIAGDTLVIEDRRAERCDGMAEMTVLGRGDMVGR